MEAQRGPQEKVITVNFWGFKDFEPYSSDVKQIYRNLGAPMCIPCRPVSVASKIVPQGKHKHNVLERIHLQQYHHNISSQAKHIYTVQIWGFFLGINQVPGVIHYYQWAWDTGTMGVFNPPYVGIWHPATVFDWKRDVIFPPIVTLKPF